MSVSDQRPVVGTYYSDMRRRVQARLDGARAEAVALSTTGADPRELRRLEYTIEACERALPIIDVIHAAAQWCADRDRLDRALVSLQSAPEIRVPGDVSQPARRSFVLVGRVGTSVWHDRRAWRIGAELDEQDARALAAAGWVVQALP